MELKMFLEKWYSKTLKWETKSTGWKATLNTEIGKEE